MKKTYQKPVINTVRINTELPMAASAYMETYDDTTVAGIDALGNMESGLDVWGNKNGSMW